MQNSEPIPPKAKQKSPGKVMLRVVGGLSLFLLLTLLTQVGGVILLLCLPLFRWIEKRWSGQKIRQVIKWGLFLGIYLTVSLLVVPQIARPYGRVPLPVFSNPRLKPLNIGTCLLNRHYIRPELLEASETAAEAFEKQHPGAVVAYLDAGFPFWNGFPLLPHLSHDDGKKLDLAFLYQDAESGDALHRTAPSLIGYGGFSGPKNGETDQTRICREGGHFQYNLLDWAVPDWTLKTMKLDEKRTKDLVHAFVNQPQIGKIFIEPHLKTRMNLQSGKIRFHGCHAVRHDDHLHVQLH